MPIASQRLGQIAVAAIALGTLHIPVLVGQEVSAKALYDQAGAALDAGDNARAVQLYQQVLKQRPDSIEARANLGAALAHEGRYDEAIEQYRRALAHDP